MASIIASYGNGLIISTSFQVVSSSIKKYFKKGDFPGGVKAAAYVFKQLQVIPAELSGAFKRYRRIPGIVAAAFFCV